MRAEIKLIASFTVSFKKQFPLREKVLIHKPQARIHERRSMVRVEGQVNQARDTRYSSERRGMTVLGQVLKRASL